MHKTEIGGVKLNLNNPIDIENAFNSIIDAGKTHYPNADIDGVIVSEMVTDGVETVLGVINDDQLMELFDKVNSYDNLIIIGDFGRSLRRKNLMKYLIVNQLYFLAPDSATTIKQLPEGDEQDKSNIVDQVIFKVAKYITEEQRQRQILEDAKPKTFFESIFGSSNVNRPNTPIESPVSKEADETQNSNTPLVQSTPIMQGGVLYKIEYS